MCCHITARNSELIGPHEQLKFNGFFFAIIAYKHYTKQLSNVSVIKTALHRLPFHSISNSFMQVLTDIN